jgi:hypothetical protein
MPKYYSFEKGKYGGATGTIFPFPRTLSGKDPSGTDWTTFVPAGYLRCDGSILPADRYRRLAEVIGVGSDCIYRKPNTTLDEADEQGNGGEIQLPDLGSKYITAFSSNTGLFLDATSANPNSPGTETEKVGIGVSLNLNQGNSISVAYSGNFTLPLTNIPISGNYAMSMESISAPGTFTDEQILAHGHYVNAARLKEETPRFENLAVGNRRRGGDIEPQEEWVNVVEFETVNVGVAGSVSSTQHFHSLSRTNPTKDISVNIPVVNNISIEPITTTVNLASENTTAFNDINHAFILVEYLIKY